MLIEATLAWAIASQDAPRFVMEPQPGDALKAELFRLAGTDPDRQVQALLGDDAAGEVLVQGSGPLNMAYREGSLPDGPLVLYASAAADHEPDAACRLTRQPGGAIDNSERATRWCLSFVLKLAPTLNIPPAPL